MKAAVILQRLCPALRLVTEPDVHRFLEESITSIDSLDSTTRIIAGGSEDSSDFFFKSKTGTGGGIKSQSS